MVSEFQIKEAARKMEARAKEGERKLSMNGKKLDALLGILWKNGAITDEEMRSIQRIVD